MSLKSPELGLLLEMPQLNLAVEGFTPAQTAQLEGWLAEFDQAADPSLIRWQLSGLHSADALIQAIQSPSRPAPEGLPTHVFWASRQEAALELASQSKQRLFQLLLDLNNPMQAAATRFVMGAVLVDRHSSGEPMRGLWHVQAAESLLAVVDFDRVMVSIRPDAHYLELEDAHWAARSTQAKAPLHFLHIPIERLMWEYARRSGRDLLPPRYHQRPITLRRYPRLPLTCLNETELGLLTVLRQQPMTLAQLSIKLQLPLDQTSHLLGALYFSGAITSRKLSMWERLRESLSSPVRLPFGNSQTIPSSHDDIMAGSPSLILGQTPRTDR